jgi:hypothetical protein
MTGEHPMLIVVNLFQARRKHTGVLLMETLGRA